MLGENNSSTFLPDVHAIFENRRDNVVAFYEKESLTSTEIGSIWLTSLVMLKIDAQHMPLVNTGPLRAFLLSSLFK